MQQEEWLPVVGYEEFYEISSRGRVKSFCIDPAGRIDQEQHGYPAPPGSH
jgi:hypothetical protein